MLGLRLQDLYGDGFDRLGFAGLALLVAAVAGAVAWLVSRVSDRSSRRAASAILLAASLPFVVIAARSLSPTAPLATRYPAYLALTIVALGPLLVADIYRRSVNSRSRVRLLVGSVWLVPALVILIATFWPGLGKRQEGIFAPRSTTVDTDSSPSGPPVVWITIDTLRADHLPIHGYDLVMTPVLEAFARSATVYRNCIAQAPETSQSVPSMLSGTTPFRHSGVTEGRPLSEDVVLLPEVLGELGYRTIALSANPWVSRTYGLGQGFDEFYLYNTDDELFLYDIMKVMVRLVPWQTYSLRELLPNSAYVPARELIDDSIEILRTLDRSRPFFLFLQPLDPHGPYQPPSAYLRGPGREFGQKDYVSFYDLEAGRTVTQSQLEAIVARYDAEIDYTDAQLGRLFEALRELDLFDPALIVVTSDHGEHFYERGLWRHGTSMYQPLLHVPLLVKQPGQRRGDVVQRPVATIDIFPSILGALGRDCATCDGQPLSEAAANDDRVLLAYLMNTPGTRPKLQAVIAGGWKLIRTHSGDGQVTEELFHLDADPREQHDLAASRPEIVDELSLLLERYESTAEAHAPAEEFVPDPTETERLRTLGYVE
jgi:arylsulfatase A-like enzyme